jgi:hypothetical protein
MPHIPHTCPTSHLPHIHAPLLISPPFIPPSESQIGEAEGEARRLTLARSEALERAEVGESHVMEVLQRQEEARAHALEERRGYVERLVSGGREGLYKMCCGGTERRKVKRREAPYLSAPQSSSMHPPL